MTPFPRNVPMVLAAAFLCAGCALLNTDPVYRVHKSYQMPAASQARSLTLQCEEIKYDCLQLAETRKQGCMPQIEREYAACMKDLSTAPFQCDGRRDSAISRCDESSVCEQRYDTCFERSGGTIQRTRRCVRNCQNAT